MATAEDAARWAASGEEYLSVCGAMASARFHEDERLRRLANDADVRWVVRENLKKARLERLDAEWVASLRARG